MSGTPISRAWVRRARGETPVPHALTWRGPVRGPPPRTALSGLGTLSPPGRIPPSATSAAAPPPTRAPLPSPSHAGCRAAGHPGPGRPRLPRPRLGRILERCCCCCCCDSGGGSCGGRWTGMQTRGGCGMLTLQLAPLQLISDPGAEGASLPPRLPPRPRPLARRRLDTQKYPASAPRPAPAPPLGRHATPTRKCSPAFSGAATLRHAH